MFEIFIGISNVISTSEIRKITVNEKKCIEKDNLTVHFGSKPHSNGEYFSRSVWGFLLVSISIYRY